MDVRNVEIGVVDLRGLDRNLTTVLSGRPFFQIRELRGIPVVVVGSTLAAVSDELRGVPGELQRCAFDLNSSCLMQNSSFLVQDSSFLMQNSSILIKIATSSR